MTKQEAWTVVDKIFPTDYEIDFFASKQVGYDVYRHHTLNQYNYICDLGCRLEINVDGKSVNLYID